MPSFIPMVCPTCGSKLEATVDPGRYACPSCGNEFLLENGGQLATTAETDQVTEAVRQARARRTAEAQARIVAQVKTDWENKQAAFQREQPLRYWLEENKTLVSAVVAVIGLLLMGLVYVVIAMR
jgi:transposase-like protein